MSPEQMKRARRRLGLSVNDMADRLGITSRHLRRMEVEEGRASHRPVPEEVEAKVNQMLMEFGK
jgi:cytoskeletal protein RodZ